MIEFLGEEVELSYPSSRADIEPLIQTQIDLDQANTEHGNKSAQAIACMVELAAACIAVTASGDRSQSEWFEKLYQYQRETGEHLMTCALVKEAMARCGLSKASTALGKAVDQSE